MASESSAVKTLLKPVLVKLQLFVKVILNALFKQNDVPEKVGVESVGAFIVIFEPLVLPVSTGFELIILTRYVVPVAVLKGMVALTFPEVAVLVVTGLRDIKDEKVASVAN